jgi:dihydropteroate synthase
LKLNDLKGLWEFERKRPFIMGILNLDSESFYKESIVTSIDQGLHRVNQMLEDGMDILDIGGFSSRPGSIIPDFETERTRLIPYLKAICKRFPDLVISIDTMRSEIAKESIDIGAEIINDISASEFDSAMPKIMAESGKIYIAMHMKGMPENMMHPSNTTYDNVITELIGYFSKKIADLNKQGVKNIIIDPGFGFSKTLNHNYYLLSNLHLLGILETPVLAGVSRKSMIWKALDTKINDSLVGSLVAGFYAMLKGCKILRVHDIRETVYMLAIYNALQNSSEEYSMIN